MFSRFSAANLKTIGNTENNKMWSTDIAESIYNKGLNFMYTPFVFI